MLVFMTLPYPPPRPSPSCLWSTFGRSTGNNHPHSYVEGDTFVVATAIIVAAVVGPGALLYAWAVYCRKGFRFSVGILVCSASLYTQLLRYVTKSSGQSASEGEGVGGGGGGGWEENYAVFVAASVFLALLQICGASAVLVYNIRGMSKRVHAAEVQYKALLIEHDRLESTTSARQQVGRAARGRSERQQQDTETKCRRRSGGLGTVAEQKA